MYEHTIPLVFTISLSIEWCGHVIGGRGGRGGRRARVCKHCKRHVAPMGYEKHEPISVSRCGNRYLLAFVLCERAFRGYADRVLFCFRRGTRCRHTLTLTLTLTLTQVRDAVTPVARRLRRICRRFSRVCFYIRTCGTYGCTLLFLFCFIWNV